MKNLFIIFAIACFVALISSASYARDALVDALIKKGVLNEEDVAACEAEAGNTNVQSYSKDIYLGGYVQALYSMFDDATGKDDTFSVQRAYMWVKGCITPGYSVFVSWYIQNPVLIDAMVTANVSPMLNINLGQLLLPFSYEQLTSSSATDTIMRAVVSDKLADHRDIGLRFDGAFMEDKVAYGLAVVNGSGINTADNNDKKDIVARIQVRPMLKTESPLEGLLLAAAVQTGDEPMFETVTDPLTGDITKVDLGDQTRTRYIGTAVWRIKQFKVQGEYLNQKLDVQDLTSDGYYALATYDIATGNMTLQPVVKYEQFDPNNDVDDDDSNITTVGVNLFLDKGKKTRVAVNYRIIDETPSVDNNEVLAQWQHIF